MAEYTTAFNEVHSRRAVPHRGPQRRDAVAFDICKRVECVEWIIILDLPPHIQFRLRELGSAEILFDVAMSLRLFPDDEAGAVRAEFDAVIVFLRGHGVVRALDVNSLELLRELDSLREALRLLPLVHTDVFQAQRHGAEHADFDEVPVIAFTLAERDREGKYQQLRFGLEDVCPVMLLSLDLARRVRVDAAKQPCRKDPSAPHSLLQHLFCYPIRGPPWRLSVDA
ncbi:hypothetical protein AURDEDRAFT_131986 [Auricularia subglabra TFB-10046 SS5]|uniref:Uncharacterized protein n=1 Tax=Auricularia subglabra (strain TFB-10046 / SS5) TaxID=717982 RepID=J0L8W8_AURST|nr:hypothetical protein AURDEDRAFT_131986 [Auricularia subglabra TFB-10046 SS5]